MLRRVIAVDPGRSSGVAAFSGVSLRSVAHVKTDAIDPWRKLDALRSALRSLDVPTTRGGKVRGMRVHFVTEAQFLGRDVRALLDIARNAACWEVCAQLLGCELLPQEHPASWQAAFGWHGKGKSTAWRKRQMCRVAEDRYGAALGPLAGQIDVQCATFIGAVASMRLGGWAGKHDVAALDWEWVRAERSNHAKDRDAYKRRKSQKAKK